VAVSQPHSGRQARSSSWQPVSARLRTRFQYVLALCSRRRALPIFGRPLLRRILLCSFHGSCWKDFLDFILLLVLDSVFLLFIPDSLFLIFGAAPVATSAKWNKCHPDITQTCLIISLDLMALSFLNANKLLALLSTSIVSRTKLTMSSSRR
jgi:hypothetical protein